MKKIFIALSAVVLTACFSTSSPENGNSQYGSYKGSGGMTANVITPEAYRYHYDNGFTGVDSMGWNPKLQYVWSRAGAAKVCGIPVNDDQVIKQLIIFYGYDQFTHQMNGIEFHRMQASAQKDAFCTSERIEEIKEIIPLIEAGKLPQ